MQKTELCTITILILLILSAVSVQFAKSQSTTNLININADGSIYPQTAPILRNGNIYKLTDNISGSVAVHKSNIVIDGAGYAPHVSRLTLHVSRFTLPVTPAPASSTSQRQRAQRL